MQIESQIQLNNMEAFVLADASTTAPTSRLSEMALVARFIQAGINVPVITNMYPAMDITSAIAGTSLRITLESGDITEFALVGNPTYSEIFGDPCQRVESIRARKMKNGSEEEANEAAVRYIANLPANLFANSAGENFVDFITRCRQEVIQDLLMSDLPSNFVFENATETFSSYSLNDLLPNITSERLPIGKFCCPECSYGSNEGKQVFHILGSDGVLYQNRGSFMNTNGGGVKCRLFKDIDISTLFEISLSQLIQLGFKMEGKFTFLLEAFAYSNPAVGFLIRDYSNPRGTVEDFAKANLSTELITPRIYITADEEVDGEIKTRDASAFDFSIDNRDLIMQFMAQVPLLADGRRFELNLTRREVTINAIET